MKFLLNMNVPRRLSKRLTGEGQQTRHVGDIGMGKALRSENWRAKPSSIAMR
ncbi:MAG: hypothetical protein ACE5MK_13635 [Acidobacteriota bacterium]